MNVTWLPRKAPWSNRWSPNRRVQWPGSHDHMNMVTWSWVALWSPIGLVIKPWPADISTGASLVAHQWRRIPSSIHTLQVPAHFCCVLHRHPASVVDMLVKAALLIVIIAAFTAPSSAKSVNFTDCGSETGELVSVDITPCDSDPCVLKKGSAVKVTSTFIPHEEVTSGKVEVFVILGPLKLPYPVPPDLCGSYDLSCPLPSGKSQETVLEVTVMKSLPAVKVQFIADILDQSGKKLICGKLYAQISDWKGLAGTHFTSCCKLLEGF